MNARLDRPAGRNVLALAVAVATLLLFARTWGHDFVNYDDPDYVTANPHVQAGLTAKGIQWAFFSRDISYWHPLTWLSHMADRQVFGSWAGGHHLTSTLWHAANAALAFLVLRRLTGSLWPSLLAAAVFAWHPLRVESVAWVAERKDVLSGFWWLSCLWLYHEYARRRADGTVGARRWYAASALAFAAGLMSKPMVVTLPVVLLLLDYWPLGRWPREGAGRLVLEKLPFLALSLAVSVLTVVAQHGVGTLSTVLPLDARLANAAVCSLRYLGKLLFPSQLAVLYPHPGFWPSATIAAAVGTLIVLTGLALWQRWRRPWVLVGWGWFVVTLLPVSGIVQVGIQAMADRYTYLPLLGIELAVIWTAREVFARRQTAAVALAVAGLAALMVLTWRQLAVWRNSLVLFDRAVAVTERNYLAHNNRGLALFESGRVEEAIADYRRSLAINPAYPDANNNLGHALAQQGRPAEAMPYYRAALQAKPDHLEVLNNLANALSDLANLEEAVPLYRQVLERDPRHVNALNGYGVALAMQGQLAEAVAQFDEVLRLEPDNVSAHSNRGNACAMLGRTDEAIAHYRRALALAGDDARTHYNLGNVLGTRGDVAGAVAQYRRAVELQPVNPDAHASLGLALAKSGDRDGAVRHLQIALQQRPNFPNAKAWLEAVRAPPAGKPQP